MAVANMKTPIIESLTLIVLCVTCLVQRVQGFNVCQVQASRCFTTTTMTRTALAASNKIALTYDDISDIGVSVTVKKPLGVVFGENPDPYYGLSIDAVEPDRNGATAGLKVGQQLLAVNDQVVLGKDFDSTMDLLRKSRDPMELQVYRGSVRQLYVILDNKFGAAMFEQDDDEVEEVVMDENYESPVKVPVDNIQDDNINLGKAFAKVGAAFSLGGNKKQGGGLFGGMFSKETIQLEGDDANTLK